MNLSFQIAVILLSSSFASSSRVVVEKAVLPKDDFPVPAPGKTRDRKGGGVVVYRRLIPAAEAPDGPTRPTKVSEGSSDEEGVADSLPSLATSSSDEGAGAEAGSPSEGPLEWEPQPSPEHAFQVAMGQAWGCLKAIREAVEPVQAAKEAILRSEGMEDLRRNISEFNIKLDYGGLGQQYALLDAAEGSAHLALEAMEGVHGKISLSLLSSSSISDDELESDALAGSWEEFSELSRAKNAIKGLVLEASRLGMAELYAVPALQGRPDAVETMLSLVGEFALAPDPALLACVQAKRILTSIRATTEKLLRSGLRGMPERLGGIEDAGQLGGYLREGEQLRGIWGALGQQLRAAERVMEGEYRRAAMEAEEDHPANSRFWAQQWQADSTTLEALEAEIENGYAPIYLEYVAPATTELILRVLRLRGLGEDVLANQRNSFLAALGRVKAALERVADEIPRMEGLRLAVGQAADIGTLNGAIEALAEEKHWLASKLEVNLHKAMGEAETRLGAYRRAVKGHSLLEALFDEDRKGLLAQGDLARELEGKVSRLGRIDEKALRKKARAVRRKMLAMPQSDDEADYEGDVDS